ncbi:MAG: cytochrome c, partial [Bacteroidia bacterium]|nr:cytochrome c [Bacteroidia bacterium]
MRFLKITSVFAILAISATYARADVAEGEKLFNANCTACHAMNDKVVGPALKGVTEKFDEAWLIKWIKNSQALVKAGDAQAVKVFNEFNQMPMTSFEHLSDDQIKSILEFIKTPPAATTATAAPAENTTAAPAQEEGFYSSNTMVILSILAAALLIVFIILSR